MKKINNELTEEEVRMLQIYSSPYRATLDAETLAKVTELAGRKATLGDIVHIMEVSLKPLQELLNGAVSQGIVLQRLGQDKGHFTEEDVENTMKVIEDEKKEANKKLIKELMKQAQENKDNKAKSNQAKEFNKVVNISDKKKG